MVRRGVALLASALALWVLPGVASARGGLRATSPDVATGGEVLSGITVALAEAPTKRAEAKATDDCKKKAPASDSVAGDDIGKKDCNTATNEDPKDDVDAGDDPGIINNPDPPDEETPWVVWVGGGMLILIAAAFVLRKSAGR